MRRRLLFIGGLALLGAGAIYLFVCRASPPPSGRIQLLGYEARSNCIVATVVLTNTGSSALSFWDGAGGVVCAVFGRVRGVDTNFNSGVEFPSSMSWQKVVWASGSAQIRITLPLGTDSWRCSICAQGPSARIKVANRMMESGIWDRIHPVSQWSLELFPHKESAEREIESTTFQVATNM